MLREVLWIMSAESRLKLDGNQPPIKAEFVHNSRLVRATRARHTDNATDRILSLDAGGILFDRVEIDVKSFISLIGSGQITRSQPG